MELEQKDAPFKVSTFLRVLSIFSLINIIFWLLGGLLGLMTGPLSSEELENLIATNKQVKESFGEVHWTETETKIINLVRYTNANFYIDHLIQVGAYTLGLAGVLFMLRGRKIGFHLYIIFNLIALVAIYASAPAYAIPPFYFLFFGTLSLIFILLYGRNLKGMK